MPPYDNWESLTTNETISRLDRKFTRKLDTYSFDKSECRSCSSNTNNQSLFPVEGKCGNCSDVECLKAKNTNFLVNSIKQLVTDNPQFTVCKEQYNADAAATEQLQKDGYTIQNTEYLPHYPIAPIKPIMDDYDNMDEYGADKNKYDEKQGEYESSIKSLNDLNEQGRLKMYACVADKNIILKYQKLDIPTDPIKDKLRELQEKDNRNKEIAVEKTIADLKNEMDEMDLITADFNISEDKMLYYFMLSSLEKKYFPKFGFSEEEDSLSDEQKLSIINNLTEERKNLIRREHLIHTFKDCIGTSVKSDLFIEFSMLHIPVKLETIQNKYKNEYLKRNKRLEEKKILIINPPVPATKKSKTEVA